MGGDNVCPVCGATFTRPQHVGRHMRSHTGDKPYQCKQCPEKFARSDLLSRHVNKTHGSPDEGDGKGNGRPGMEGKKKGRKPKFTPSALALQQARTQQHPQTIVQHGQNLPQVAIPGQHPSYNLQSPFTSQAFQPSHNMAFMQRGQSGHSANPAVSSNPSAMGRMLSRLPGDQPNGVLFVSNAGNSIAPGFKVDEDEDEDGQWVNVPHDYNGFNVGNAQPVPLYMKHQQHMPTPSQVTGQQQQQQTHLPLPVQYINSSEAAGNLSLSGNPETFMQRNYTSFSPASVPMHGAHMLSNTSDSSPQMFWSDSTQYSSPLHPGMAVYSQPMPHAIGSGSVNMNAYSSGSPYNLSDHASLGGTSESPAALDMNGTRTKGSSPLVPAPAGMLPPGPIPTTYSSVMPAPLIPTDTPIHDKVEKVKKRACEACNQSKVKCDFNIPCGKCASRKLGCIYPTARKSNSKSTSNTSPLSPGTHDPTKPTSTSPGSGAREFQPMFLSEQASTANGIISSPTSLVMPADIAVPAPMSNPRRTEDAQTFSPVHLNEQSQPFDVDISNVQSQAYLPSNTTMQNQGFQISSTSYPTAFTELRQVQDEDSQSSVSGYTYGQVSGVNSRRSSLAATFTTDDQRIDNALPFDALTLNGAVAAMPGMSNGNDVQQWIASSVAVGSEAGRRRAGDAISQAESHSTSTINVSTASQMLPQLNFRWEPSPMGIYDPRSMSASDTPADAQPKQRDITVLNRPALARGRSNSFPSLYTPRGGVMAREYFALSTKDFASTSNREHSVLPQDWNMQLQHMTAQLNRNGSGTSSLQQVEDSIDEVTQSSPQNHVSSPDGVSMNTQYNLSSANTSFNPNRPGPAVIQNPMSITMAKQLLAGRGSLQTLAPERTASFLDSTPSSELDGMKWNINSTSNMGSDNTPPPFKAPNQLVRPGNKRLASQTLGPDMQKRQSTSSIENDLGQQQSSSNPSVNRVTTVNAPQLVMDGEQHLGRRASIPSWLPDPVSGNHGMSGIGINPNIASLQANPSLSLGRSALDSSPNVPASYFPDLTPTLWDPLQQGFNFTPDLNTPTVERVSFNTQSDDPKSGPAWTVHA